LIHPFKLYRGSLSEEGEERYWGSDGKQGNIKEFPTRSHEKRNCDISHYQRRDLIIKEGRGHDAEKDFVDVFRIEATRKQKRVLS